MASVSEFRNGMAILHNNDVWIVVEFQHFNPGNWRAMIRTKLKHAKTGRVIDHTFRMTDKIEEVRLEEKDMQYLYEADDNLYFMDTETYEQTFIPASLLGDKKRFLKEGNLCHVMFYEGKAISAELPFFIDFKVIEAEPGVKGDTATGVTKSAIIETGARVQVPLFVKEGDVIKIDTRTGKYLERVS
ncbi:MAG: elongation factor P [candidate division KSB1 bacterium]|nr:elongation factor P [candidate division KSB1 bacterium]